MEPLPTSSVAVGCRRRGGIILPGRAARRGRSRRTPPALVFAIGRVPGARSRASAITPVSVSVGPVSAIVVTISIAVTTATVIPVAVGIAIRVAIVAVSVAVTVTVAAMTHILSWSGSMRAVCHRIVNTDATTIEFLEE